MTFSCNGSLVLNDLIQPIAPVERFCAVMASASLPSDAVMGFKTALMAVMRLDVVSYFSLDMPTLEISSLTLRHLVAIKLYAF